VSVRSAAEAEAAVAGGAALVDVKEPTRGPLGRAEDVTVAEILRQVGGRRPVSAALGELAAAGMIGPPAGLTFLKWGLAGWRGRPDWREAHLAEAARLERLTGAKAVLAAYADWRLADSPPLEDLLALAVARPGGVFLLDTWDKKPASRDGKPFTLVDRLGVPALRRLCERCRAAGVKVALAGSLGPREIEALLPARPDWFAVRGAACHGGRGGEVDEARVRQLAELLTRHREGATAGG
jgi:uncharacterized protein (UPF0264 family)